MGVNKRWASQRLIPTGFCSLLSLVHFHAVVWRNPSRYPLLNYMSCVFESLLLLIIFTTFALNAFTQLVAEGRVSRYLFGHADTLMPRWDEDFSVVLLRLGTASLEATSVAGLGNEVSSVPLTAPQFDLPHLYGELEMNRAGVTSMTHAVDGRKRKDLHERDSECEGRVIAAGPVLGRLAESQGADAAGRGFLECRPERRSHGMAPHKDATSPFPPCCPGKGSPPGGAAGLQHQPSAHACAG